MAPQRFTHTYSGTLRRTSYHYLWSPFENTSIHAKVRIERYMDATNMCTKSQVHQINPQIYQFQNALFFLFQSNGQAIQIGIKNPNIDDIQGGVGVCVPFGLIKGGPKFDSSQPQCTSGPFVLDLIILIYLLWSLIQPNQKSLLNRGFL